MEKNKHINLAYRVVKDGVPFFAKGTFGLKKGTIAVQLGPGRIQLVCGNLIPVDLVATGVPEEDKVLMDIEQAIIEVRDKWFDTQ